ncbi:DUF6867 family protein [Chthonobacter rhizosphaerae]|uniref:DUF6867 family protein n=1 Tax=Chthonobacter rhizosphaerae TaxID=2735553 RepID=UPI0015EF3DEC|nr:hypothetical protein [Chthonobacter rhizosphaerae]
MQGILYEEPNIFLFALVTLVLGGWAAWMTGRACALTWRTATTVFLYVLVLGMAVRFIHFALFHGTLLSLHYYLVDTIILQVIAFAGYRFNLTRQMVRQYYWLYESSGPFSWKPKAAA